MALAHPVTRSRQAPACQAGSGGASPAGPSATTFVKPGRKPLGSRADEWPGPGPRAPIRGRARARAPVPIASTIAIASAHEEKREILSRSSQCWLAPTSLEWQGDFVSVRQAAAAPRAIALPSLVAYAWPCIWLSPSRASARGLLLFPWPY